MRQQIVAWFRVAAGVIYSHPWFFVLISVLVAEGFSMQIFRLHIDISK